MALQRLISMSIWSKQEQHSMIGSESPWTVKEGRKSGESGHDRVRTAVLI